MKTAQEIAEHIKQGSPFSGGFDEWEGAELIKEYAKQKVYEQQELCADFDGVDIDHTNYPEPEFD